MLPVKILFISYNPILVARHIVVAEPRSLPRDKANMPHPLVRQMQSPTPRGFSREIEMLQILPNASIITSAAPRAAPEHQKSKLTRKLAQEASCKAPRATRRRT